MSSAEPSRVKVARWNPGDVPLTFSVAVTSLEPVTVAPAEGARMQTVTVYVAGDGALLVWHVALAAATTCAAP